MRLLRTDRLLLHAPRAGDGGLINTAIVESLPELRQWLVWAKIVPTVDETEARARAAADNFSGGVDYNWVLWTPDQGTVVGMLSLHSLNSDVPSLEVGYWCRTRFAGQGLMTEAVRAVANVSFGTLAACRLEIRCDPRNEASRKVAERSGFALEAHLRNEQRAPDGSLRDTLIYARFPD